MILQISPPEALCSWCESTFMLNHTFPIFVSGWTCIENVIRMDRSFTEANVDSETAWINKVLLATEKSLSADRLMETLE